MSAADVPAGGRAPESLRALRYVVALAFRADFRGTLLLCLSIPVSFLSPALGALAVKAIADLGSAPGTSAARATVLAVLAVLAAFGSLQLSVYLIHVVGKKVDLLIQREITRMLVSLPRIEHFERPEVLDQIQVLRNEAGIIGVGMTATLNLVGTVFQSVVVCVLLAAQTPLLLLLLLFAVPSFVLQGLTNRWIRVADEATAGSDRLQRRFVDLSLQLPVAREARLFGLAGDLRARRARYQAEVDLTRGSALQRSALLSGLGNLVFAAGYFGAVALVVDRAIAGRLSVGDVVVTLVLAGQTQGLIAGLVGGVREIASVCIVGSKMEWLSRYERLQIETRPSDPPDLPSRLTDGISLENVTFRYPGTGATALHEVSLRLPAGTVVGIVGENGAGKTTLVKLLLGLYAPSGGRITIDGQDLEALDLEAWRRRTTGAFQDFCRPEYSVHDAVGIGEVHHLDDDGAVRSAVRRGTADDVVAGLPAGLATQLGASWPNGMDLSGGQWQRLSLARGKMRTVPLLTVMDEPTAALDIEAEHEMFTAFAETADAVASVGGVTVLITHRFSSVQMADTIVVLDAGRIREIGTHHELLERDGLYAELFTLQADAYR